MALTKRKRYPNTANRRKMASGVGASAQITRRTPIKITGVTFGSHTAVLTFDQVVSLNGIPQYENNASHFPTAAVVSGPDEVTLTYTDATSTSVAVPFEEPAVRNAAGGYVLPGTFSAS